MDKPRKVKPKNFSGYSATILQMFGLGPKWDITCGDCEGTFSERIPLVDNPGVKCKHCGTINIIPIVWSSD